MIYLKQLTILFFITHSLQIGYSQSYRPFYMDKAKWVMYRIYPVLGPGDGFAEWEIYTLGDTMINGIIYKIIATKNHCYSFPEHNGDPYYLNVNTNEFVFGGLREENKKVYLLRFNIAPQWELLQGLIKNFKLDTEYLLYDFDVTPGDTIHFADNKSTIIKAKSFDKENHTVYEVKNNTSFSYPYDTGSLIEGIGSSYGFFGSYDSFLSYLSCFTIDGSALIYNSCKTCKGYITQVEEQSVDVLEIYPNPTIGTIHVKSVANTKINEIQIYDAVGKLLEKNQPYSEEAILDISNYKRGFLLITVKLDNGQLQVRKLVLQ